MLVLIKHQISKSSETFYYEINNENDTKAYKNKEKRLKQRFIILAIIIVIFHISVYLVQKNFGKTPFFKADYNYFGMYFTFEVVLMLIIFSYYFATLFYLMNRYHNYEFEKSKGPMSIFYGLTLMYCL